MKGFLLRIRFLYLGFKKRNELNIGDEVLVNGNKYYLSSYKYTDTNWYDHWSMVESKTNKYEIYSTKYIKKINSIKNIKNSVLGTYKFYMMNWYSIMKSKIKLDEVFKVNVSYMLNLK